MNYYDYLNLYNLSDTRENYIDWLYYYEGSTEERAKEIANIFYA